MNKEQFQRLSMDGQAELTFAGEFISSIHQSGYRLTLYLVAGKFYVEVFCDIAENQVKSFKLADPARLKLYINDEILKNLL